MTSPATEDGEFSPDEKRKLTQQILSKNMVSESNSGPRSLIGTTKIEDTTGFTHWTQQKVSLSKLGLENPFFRVHETCLRDETAISGRSYLNFTGYNYLGYAGHPEVSAAAISAIEQFGTSVSASRIVSGERRIHQQLESSLADFMGTEDCLTFVSGHATNVTIIGHLFGKNDLILHDEQIHNSAIQGALLSGARRISFAHNDWSGLNNILRQNRSNYERALIITEGLFSMDGDIPELPRFIELKRRHNAFLMVDEAHSLGTIGATGRGIAEHFNICNRDVDLWMGTLSKSLASCGGYIAGEKTLIEYLRHTTPGFLYSVGMSPPDTAAALQSLELIRKDPSPVRELQRNAQLFRQLSKEKKFDIRGSTTGPVIPLVVGSTHKCLQLSDRLFQQGINVSPVFYPAVEEGAARIRFFLTALHKEDQITHTIETTANELQQIENEKV